MIDFEKIEGFQWDEGNTEKNPQKHGISNIESEQIFFNKPLIVSDDNFQSTPEESRFSALGKTDTGKNITVIFTIRKNMVRIISARLMSKKERKLYYEKT